MRPALPDWPDRVNDELCRQLVAFGDLRITRFAAAEQATLMHQFRPGSAMNGTIHPTATKQRGVRRVHDGIDLQRRDVGLHCSQDGHELLHGCFSVRWQIRICFAEELENWPPS